MASAGRSAAAPVRRAIAARSTATAQILSFNPVLISQSPTRPIARVASRLVSVLASTESMMPLHSAVASARLRSSIATDSTCWSWLSQGFAMPL